MTHYGPFPSFDAAYKYMRRNFANSGGYSTDKSGRIKPPRNPVKPGRGRRLWGSGAPSAEEFADTGAISNSPEVAAAASREDMLDIPEAEAVAEAGDSPPTPVEIKDGVGGAALSTLNRLVVESEDPDAAKAAEVNRTRMAAWLKELDRE